MQVEKEEEEVSAHWTEERQMGGEVDVSAQAEAGGQQAAPQMLK